MQTLIFITFHHAKDHVPKGVEHLPRTNGEEVWIMLIEPQSTQHTGEVVHEKTVTELEWI